MHSRGVTRIETVVVLAILAVALALSLRGILVARERARIVRSKNNLRQLGLRMQDSRLYGTEDATELAVNDPELRMADEFAERRFVTAVIVAIAMVPLVLGAFFIWLVIHSINARDNELDDSSSFLERWFCPPSSSPI